jgi:cytochrome b
MRWSTDPRWKTTVPLVTTLPDMAENSTHTDEAAEHHESRMVRAIIHDMAIALPVALVALTVALVLFTDKSVGDAIATAVLPGVLIGVFFGGFSGTARTMD